VVESRSPSRSKPLISRRAVTAFKEELKSATMAVIDDLFQDLGFNFSVEGEEAENVSSVRRKRAAGYLATLDLAKPRDARRLVDAMERRIRDVQSLDTQFRDGLDWFLKQLANEGLSWREDHLVVPGLSDLPALPFREALATLGAPHVTDEVNRILESLDTDPEDAITASRALVESVCKAVLEELGQEVNDKDDLPVLYKRTAVALGIDPTQHEAGIHKQILQGLVSTIQGLAEVRNVLGDAHGKRRAAARAQPRHARVVAGAAWTVSTFLTETLAERQRSAQ
jgi:hypothetical protein